MKKLWLAKAHEEDAYIMGPSCGRRGEVEIEKDPVDLFPTEPTDEARQGEETLDLGSKDLIGLLIKS